jgi:hypothetical protein
VTNIDPRVLTLIQNMMAKEASLRKIGTEAALNEASVAASKVAELCLRHKIELTQVELQSTEARRAKIGRALYEYDGTEEYRAKSRQAWEISLANSVARAHSCRILIGRGYLVFIGEEEDRQVGMTMFRILRREVTQACTFGYRRARSEGRYTRGFIASFFASAVAMISTRYREMRDRVVAETNSTALVRVIDQELDVFANAQATGKDKTKYRGQYNAHGIERGREFGRRVSLDSRALDSTAAPARRLGAG